MHSLDSTYEQESARGDGADFHGLQKQESGLSRSDPPLEMKDQYASEERQLRQMAYDSNFAEDINMRMRIPTKLTVASHGTDDDFLQWPTRASNGDILSKMEVPDRIVISVGENGTRYGGAQGSSGSLYAENFLVDGSASEHLFLTTPPRKLTLAERNLDALDIPEHQEAQSQQQRIENKSSSVIRMNRLVSDPQQNDSSEELDDVSLLRHQIFKLHRRITAIEKQQGETSKRDICIYAVTIAFWVLNGWFLFSSRRPY